MAESMPPELLIQLFDLPISLKREMMESSKQMQQAKAEQAKLELMKPPSMSMSLDDIQLFGSDPMAQAQVAQKFGIQISKPVESEQSKKLAFDEWKHKTMMKMKELVHDEKTLVQIAQVLGQDDRERDSNEVQREKIRKDSAGERKPAQGGE
jgi:hypothetical protein